ncbi:MAG TPA: Glu/Leu/Phe/Val dehydrogenase dimerization domain-containing protein [Solirubrobacterales bacterium]
MKAIAAPSSREPRPKGAAALVQLDGLAPGERVALRAGELPGGLEHEELVIQRGERSGALMAIAIHSTRLGPALGGLRLWTYAAHDHAVEDVLRLAEAMTYKAAAAGLDLGGGKGVICAPGSELPTGEQRRAVLLDFGDLVESLGGRYITAEDVGTSAEDMLVIAERTEHVTGRPVEAGGAGDPSPYTAIGVEAAMRAACAHGLGTPVLADLRIVIVGVGHVGERLARSLAARGAKLTLSDIAPRGREIAEELGAGWVDPDEAMTTPCEVLAPCAVGGVINPEVVDRLRCRVICGAANNQLATDAMGERLARRRIVYAPDFIANAGGLIACYRELKGYDADRARMLALGIEDVMGDVLRSAARRGITPVQAARELAEARLQQSEQ